MTSPLGAVLRELGNNANPGALPQPDLVRARGDRRRRRVALSATTAAVAAAATLAQVLAISDGSGRGQQPAEPLPSPTVTPESQGQALGPNDHVIARHGERFSVDAVAVSNGTFVVVGDSSDIDQPGPAVYWSQNGVDWQPPPEGDEPASVNVTDVIATDDGFLAVGIGADGPAAWRSLDGRGWVESAVPASDDRGASGLWGITATRMGYFAWGFDGGRASLWRSTDGTEWATLADASVFDLPQTETICAMEDAAGGLRATGVEAARNTREGHSVVWTSTDGETWKLTEDRTGDTTIWCDPSEELGHWEARGETGVARIFPNGEGDFVQYVPAEH
jgi:hypothetical protein